jgi:hypothetical protein
MKSRGEKPFWVIHSCRRQPGSGYRVLSAAELLRRWNGKLEHYHRTTKTKYIRPTFPQERILKKTIKSSV